MRLEVISVTDAVTDALRRRLLTGHYKGGQSLRDTELATEFGVARPTVRAAVQTLVSDGLLERDKGKSATVPQLTAVDALDLYRLRRAIELCAVEIVSENSADLSEIENAAHAFVTLPEGTTWDVVSEHDVAFHSAVFQATDSPRLIRTFESVAVETRLMIAQLAPSYSSIAELANEHWRLYEVLKTKKLKEIKQAWNEHFDKSEAFFLQLIKETSS